MGNTCHILQKRTIEYDDFCPLRIATLYVDLDESINKKSKIATIVEYFMKPYAGYKLDVLCLQGIRNIKIMRELVFAFKQTIEKYNDDLRNGYNDAIYLEYYPDIEVSTKESNDIYWSTSEGKSVSEYYDKLIISRHRILHSANVHIGSDYNRNFPNINSKFGPKNNNILCNNSDSDEISNIYKYVQVVNLNVDGTFVSIYNVELDDNSIGISNTKERKRQIQSIKRIVDENRQRCLISDLRQFVHGDCTYIACNRDIHVVTGMFHINELKNNSLSSEYTKMCSTINGFDVNRWVMHLKKEVKSCESCIRFTKDTFTMMVSKGVMSASDEQARSHKLYEDHKVVIISSHIAKSVVDMNKFTNYPEDTIFMMYKPNIEHFTTKKMNSRALPKNASYTTRFIDRASKEIIDNIHKMKYQNNVLANSSNDARSSETYSYNPNKHIKPNIHLRNLLSPRSDNPTLTKSNENPSYDTNDIKPLLQSSESEKNDPIHVIDNINDVDMSDDEIVKEIHTIIDNTNHHL